MSDTDSTDDDPVAPGTARAARLVKAGCGIRFEEDELSEGIAFEGVEKLRPEPDGDAGKSDDH